MKELRPLIAKIVRKLPEDRLKDALRALAGVAPGMVVADVIDLMERQNRKAESTVTRDTSTRISGGDGDGDGLGLQPPPRDGEGDGEGEGDDD